MNILKEENICKEKIGNIFICLRQNFSPSNRRDLRYSLSPVHLEENCKKKACLSKLCPYSQVSFCNLLAPTSPTNPQRLCRPDRSPETNLALGSCHCTAKCHCVQRIQLVICLDQIYLSTQSKSTQGNLWGPQKVLLGPQIVWWGCQMVWLGPQMF